MRRVKETKLYDLLGVQPSATPAEIQKAYKKKARELHPDRNPHADPEEFKAVAEAYEVLSDEAQRHDYDEYGEEGLKDDGSHHDMFSDLFGFGGGGGRRQKKKKAAQKRKGESAQQQLPVSLEDMYNGKTIKLKLTKDVLCPGCDGKGSSDPSAVTTCRSCRGQGVQVRMRQIGMGMMQQQQITCQGCQGSGESIPDAMRCRQCYGRKVTEEQKVLEVHVDRGMMNNHKITFRGESDQSPDTEPGDVIIILKQRQHGRFKRDGSHLYVEKDITLKEAICGFEITVPHFNGRSLVVRSNPKENIIQDGMIMKVPEEGMPVYKRPYVRGNLYIKFTVVFPQPHMIRDDAVKKLADLLPGPKLPAKGEHESVGLERFDPHEMDPANRTDKEAYEDDDEEDDGHGGHHQGVQCAHQ